MLAVCQVTAVPDPATPRVSCVNPSAKWYQWKLRDFWQNADVDDVRGILACISVGERDALGRTPLHLAAMYGADRSVVAALLERGADTQARDDFGDTPLHSAARASKPSAVEVLLDFGANIEATDDLDNTPLEEAAEYGDLATMSVLLDRGAEVGDLYWSKPTLRQLIDEREPGIKPAVLGA